MRALPDDWKIEQYTLANDASWTIVEVCTDTFAFALLDPGAVAIAWIVPPGTLETDTALLESAIPRTPVPSFVVHCAHAEISQNPAAGMVT